MGNWGRWGSADERGALNLVDEAAARRGLDSVRAAHSVSLGLPLQTGRGPLAAFRQPVQHFMTRDGGDYAAGLAERSGVGFSDDSILLACHGSTHLDALSHVWHDGLMWNGFSASTVTSRGAARCGIEKVGPIVTRALFVDFARSGEPLAPGEEITAARLEAAVAAAGVRPEPGDALIVRTGWLSQWRAGAAGVDRWPGLGADCGEWLTHHDIALTGADNLAVEVGPSTVPDQSLPLHVSAIRDAGSYFLELLDLEELAAKAPAAFLLVVAPLNIVGGVGSPVAPVAIC